MGCLLPKDVKDSMEIIELYPPNTLRREFSVRFVKKREYNAIRHPFKFLFSWLNPGFDKSLFDVLDSFPIKLRQEHPTLTDFWVITKEAQRQAKNIYKIVIKYCPKQTA